MTTRRKSKQQYESTTSIDEKEHADRIAAAEAMSCLSSMVVLPSNPDDLFAVTNDIKIKNTKNVDTKNYAKSATSTANKKGKTRTRAPKNSPSSAARKKSSPNEKNESSSSKLKVKTPKYAPTLAVNNKKQKLPDQVLSLTINPRNPNHEPKKGEGSKILAEELRKKDYNIIHPPALTPAYIQVEQSGITKPCLIQVDHNKPGLGLYNLSSTDLHKILAGKLPFQVKSDNAEEEDITAKAIASKLVTLASTESVELSQSAVDNLISQVVLKGKESSESSLPLKKRRLQGYKEDDLQIIEDDKDRTIKQDTSSVRGVAVKSTSVVEERVNPVAVDPSTSLMLLNEMQVALQQDEDGDLPLHIAVVHENIVMVQKFVHLMSISGKSVDKYNKAQQTPLHIAVELNFMQAVHTLLLAGGNPNLVNKNGENCIHMAVKSNSLYCLQLIFKYSNKIDINARNFDGLAPIHVAVIKNNVDIVRFLLAEKADINIQDGKSGRTPLFYAVEGNNVLMVDLFQKVGANLDLPNYASITAVMAAQARGFHEVASMLLRCMDSKAYLDMKEKEKGTPLKKIPIPRIPSKTHLIQGSEYKPGMVDLQQLTNSDSNDSVQSFNSSRKQTKNLEVKKENHPSTLDKPEHELVIHENILQDNKQLQNGVQDARNEVTKQENSEGILIPRELLERLQNTMLTLLAMQKVQQTESGLQLSSSTTASQNIPVQSTSGITLASIIQNSLRPNIASPIHSQEVTGTSAKQKIMDSKNLNLNKRTDVVVDLNKRSDVVVDVNINLNKISDVAVDVKGHSEKQQDSRTRHIMLQQLLNVKPSDLENSVEKKRKAIAMENSVEKNRKAMELSIENSAEKNRKAVELAIENSAERHRRAMELAIENSAEKNRKAMELASASSTERRKKSIESTLENLAERKRKSLETTMDNSIERRKKSLEAALDIINETKDKSLENRVEEPMDISDSNGSSESSQLMSSKFGKNPGGVGHAAMNQLGRVTNVSTSLQATLLQMLQAKQNKPLNLTKESSNSS